MRRFIVITLSLAWTTAVSAQNRTEALERSLACGALPVPERIAIYDTLSWGYLDSDLGKALAYAAEGLELARDGRHRTGEGRLSHNLGVVYYRLSDFAQAEEHLIRAADIAVDMNDRALEMNVYASTGNLYNTRRNFKRAMEYYQRALDIAGELGDESKMSHLYSNMGTVMSVQNQWQRSLPLYYRSQEIAERLKDTRQMALVHFNLGLAYRSLGVKDSAGFHIMEADRLADIAGVRSLKASTLMGLASYYNWNDEREKALETNIKALSIAEEVGSPSVITDSKKNVAFSHLALGHDRKVLEMVDEILPGLDSTEYKQFYDLHYAATVANIRTGNKAAALEHLEGMLWNIGKNNDEESWNALAEMETRYETEKKELRIAALADENKLYLTLAIVAGLAIVILALTLIIYNRYQRLKRLRSQEELDQVRRESQLVAANSLLTGEIHERGRLSRELHDGLGGLLTMIKLNLSQARDPRDPKIDSAIILTDHAIADMRRMAHNLMPESLRRFGLKSIIEQYCAGMDIISFHFFGQERRFDERVELNFYRISGELINNALKHSAATEINVQVVMTEDILSLTVADNGRGFSKEDVHDGLITVRSRAEILGACMNIYSEPGHGAEITVELELNGKTV